jgi:hypothetical protein
MSRSNRPENQSPYPQYERPFAESGSPFGGSFNSHLQGTESRIVEDLQRSPNNLHPVFHELNNLRKHESAQAFGADLARINDDVHQQGLLPNFQIVGDRHGRLGLQQLGQANASEPYGEAPEEPMGRQGGSGRHRHGRRRSERFAEQPEAPSGESQYADNSSFGSGGRGGRGGSGFGFPGFRFPGFSPDASVAPNRGQTYRGGGEIAPGDPRQKAEMTRIVVEEAQKQGLSRTATIAAVAAMLQESGGNPGDPRRPDKGGDNGHSKGLFQLNFAGGEGTEFQRANHLSRTEAVQRVLDPRTNAAWALQYFRQYQGTTANHGMLARMAQKPGDPNYVHNVNRWVPEATRLVAETLG